MGATVTTGKCAAAFHSSNGELLYILFERSYEKNCYPHIDHWSAFAFGTREEVLRRAFVGASDCCGGALQSRSGEIKPETGGDMLRFERSAFSWENDAIPTVGQRLSYDVGTTPQRGPCALNLQTI